MLQTSLRKEFELGPGSSIGVSETQKEGWNVPGGKYKLIRGEA